MLEKVRTFHGEPISMSKMVLKDANLILIPVMTTISKFSMGNLELFTHFKTSDVVSLQELICKYVKYEKTGKNLTLFDLSDNLQDLSSLAVEFLEFNFGVFTQGRKILERILGDISDQKETTNP